MSSLISAPSAIAQVTVSPQFQVQAQVDRRQLIAVAASATQDKKYFLALRVATNVVEIFPDYGTGYLYRAIAKYRLGKRKTAKVEFAKAKELYLTLLKSAKISIQEKNEANSGLEVAELHLHYFRLSHELHSPRTTTHQLLRSIRNVRS